MKSSVPTPAPARTGPTRVTASARTRQAATAAALVALTLGTLLAAHPAVAGKAHQHGVAKLDVALEGQQLTLELDSPLDNLLGFERAPRTAAERQRADAMATRLRQPQTLFQPDAAAGCTPGPVALNAPVLGLSDAAGAPAAAPGAAAASDHADLAARFVFTCTRPEALRQVEVGLFKGFSGFKRIETQVVTPRGQARRTLTPAAPRLALPD